MVEHYDGRTLARTLDLYRATRTWAEERRDVTIIGGWAVYEMVEEGHAMQSRDVDLVLHSEEALRDLLSLLPKWDLKLRRSGRKTSRMRILQMKIRWSFGLICSQPQITPPGKPNSACREVKTSSPLQRHFSQG